MAKQELKTFDFHTVDVWTRGMAKEVTRKVTFNDLVGPNGVMLDRTIRQVWVDNEERTDGIYAECQGCGLQVYLYGEFINPDEDGRNDEVGFICEICSGFGGWEVTH